MTRGKRRYLLALVEGRLCCGCGLVPAVEFLEECVPCWDKRTDAEEAEWRSRYNR